MSTFNRRARRARRDRRDEKLRPRNTQKRRKRERARDRPAKRATERNERRKHKQLPTIGFVFAAFVPFRAWPADAGPLSRAVSLRAQRSPRFNGVFFS